MLIGGIDGLSILVSAPLHAVSRRVDDGDQQIGSPIGSSRSRRCHGHGNGADISEGVGLEIERVVVASSRRESGEGGGQHVPACGTRAGTGVDAGLVARVIVIAGGDIRTIVHAIADAIVVGVSIHHVRTTARVTATRQITRLVGVCATVIVARLGIGAQVGPIITNAIIVHITVYHGTRSVCLTRTGITPGSINAKCIVGVRRGVIIVVARRCIRAAGDLIGIANTVPVSIRTRKRHKDVVQGS